MCGEFEGLKIQSVVVLYAPFSNLIATNKQMLFNSSSLCAHLPLLYFWPNKSVSLAAIVPNPCKIKVDNILPPWKGLMPMTYVIKFD